MPLLVPIPSSVIAELAAEDVWTYATRLLTNPAAAQDLLNMRVGISPTATGRAALLDQITAARLAELDPANLPADVATLLSRLTAARALLLDNLLSIEASDTIVHPAGTLEQDSLEISPTELTDYAIVLLDMDTLTQNITIRTYIKIDSANYILISSAVFPTDFPTNAKGVPIQLYPMSVGWKITLQSTVTEGVSRNIPLRYVRRSLV